MEYSSDGVMPLAAKRLLITIAAGVMAAAILRAEPLQSANDRSRWCTVYALVENGSYAIDGILDEPGWQTIDIVRHEGHFYSTKPALLPTLVAGLYWLIKQATGWTLLENTAAVTRTILLLINLLPMLAALVVLSRMLQRYAKTDMARLFVLATASVGTFLTTFTVTLNNHTVAATAVVFALDPALRILADGRREWWRFATCGFFAAWACTNELPAALFGLALFGLLVWKSPAKTLPAFVPAALVPLAGFFVTTYLSTGGLKPFYMYYGTEKYEFIHEGVPSYWMNPSGLDRAVDSTLTYLLHCTVGHHGILSLSPVFLLAVAAWLRPGLWRRAPLAPAIWMGLGLTLAVLGFYLSRTENYNYGGNTAGLRWTFWLIPFWLLAMVPALDAWGERLWVRLTTAGLLFVSIFSALWPIDDPWQSPWLFVLMDRAGRLEQYHQEPPPFDRRLTTFFPSLPEPTKTEPHPWIELAGPAAGGGTTHLRLTLIESDEQTATVHIESRAESRESTA
ncbi:MAG: hypothetical protein ACREJB_03695, partial [Planctomycetaceae bacterium]